MKTSLTHCLCAIALASALPATEPVSFNARTAHDGKWSDPTTWEGGRAPRAGDLVKGRAGPAVIYAADRGDARRRLRVAGAQG